MSVGIKVPLTAGFKGKLGGFAITMIFIFVSEIFGMCMHEPLKLRRNAAYISSSCRQKKGA